MLRVIYACITEQHDLRLVVLAGLLCLFACFTAINLFVHAAEAKGRARTLWHAAASVVFGAGVWATHFVAELAYKPGVPVGYDVDLTVLSIAIAMAVTWIGIAVALRYKANEVGGAIVGGAVGCMHYVGMAALRVPADLHWNFAYVGTSVAIGVCFGAGALRVLASGVTLRYRLTATTLLVLAIVGLHFTAMAAVVLELNPYVGIPDQVMAPELLAIAVAAVTVLIAALGLSSAFVDDQLARRAISEAELLAQRVDERTAELHKTQEALLRQERQSALGQLTASMAHELRNPLSAIANTLHTVKEAVAKGGLDLERPITRMERSIARCDRIINDLLDYSRMRELRRRTWNVDPWLEEALDDLKVPDGIGVVRRLGAPGRQASFDSDLMRRAISNLVENAAHAVENAHGKSRRIVVSTRTVESELEFSITDTGPGISSDVLPRVFEPLFSTKGFGAGLGLPMVRQIVEQHDGRVEIASTPGTGTTVTIRLPLTVSAPKAAAA